jgi:YfiH family protein
MPTAFTDRSRRVPTGLPSRVVYMRQVHGAEVAYVAEPFGTSRPGLDAVFTDQPGLALGVAVADCAPVLVTAPGWVGAAHSGRTGTAAGVVPALVRAMAARGADVAGMSAVVGPNACGKCYEVPAEMRADMAATLPSTWATTSQGTPALDIRAGIVAQLTALGVTTIRHDNRCTIESRELCSYRRDRSRDCFAGFVWLP